MTLYVMTIGKVRIDGMSNKRFISTINLYLTWPDKWYHGEKLIAILTNQILKQIYLVNDNSVK